MSSEGVCLLATNASYKARPTPTVGSGTGDSVSSAAEVLKVVIIHNWILFSGGEALPAANRLENKRAVEFSKESAYDDSQIQSDAQIGRTG